MQEDLSKLATFSTKIAEDEPTCIEILDVQRKNSENNEAFSWNQQLSLDQSPELKHEQPETSSPMKKDCLSYQITAQKRDSVKKSLENITQGNKLEENLLAEEDEKVNFKSFQILKIIGSGAFGKIFLVIFLIIYII